MQPIKLFYLILGLLFFNSCQTNNSSNDKKNNGGIIRYKITGSLDAQHPALVYLQHHDNKLQQFQRTATNKGNFILEGELASDGFYDVIIKSDSTAENPFRMQQTIYLEPDADYEILIKNSQVEVKTNSVTTNEFIAFNKNKLQKTNEVDEKLANIMSRSSLLEEKLRTASRLETSIYNRITDSLDILSKLSAGIRNDKNEAKLYEEYVSNSKQKSSLLIPYAFKYIAINKGNYDKYYKILTNLDPMIEDHPLVKAARNKVAEVKDFYENMPAFPDITPRNLKGDSLKFDQLQNKKMIIAVMWSTNGKYSKMDLPVLLKKESELNDLGVAVIYLTDDNDYERWRAANESIGLGLNSYLLNVTDRDFIHDSYQVTFKPRYIWINPKTRAIMELSGADPTLANFIQKVKDQF